MYLRDGPQNNSCKPWLSDFSKVVIFLSNLRKGTAIEQALQMP